MINYEFLYNPLVDVNKNPYVNKNLSYLDIENGYIIPSKKNQNYGGVLYENGEYVKQSAVHTNSSNGYQINLDNCIYRDETVVYISLFLNIWGHWLTDNIRRVWFLESNYYKKLKNVKLVYVTTEDFEISKNVKELFQLLEIDITKFEKIDKITKFKHIILPEESFFTIDGAKRFYTKEYISTINKIIRNFNILASKGKVNCETYDSIYFSYSKAGRYKIVGEKKLEWFFKKQGYKIIYPENYSFYEQLFLLSKCKNIASTIGSCSHNFIFAKDNANIILIPRANYFTGYQIALNDMIKNHTNIYFVDSSLSIYANPNSPWDGPFYYFISDNLLDYFGLSRGKNKCMDFYLYKIFGCLCAKQNKKSKTYEYYSSELNKLGLHYDSIIKPNIFLYKVFRKLISFYNYL